MEALSRRPSVSDAWGKMFPASVTQPLSREEERELTRLACEGDEVSRNRLIASNLRMVFKIVCEYRRRSSPEFEDLVQEGALGLMRAAEKFEPERGLRFMTYGAWWVRSFVTKALAERESDSDHLSLDGGPEGASVLDRLGSSGYRADLAHERVEALEVADRLLGETKLGRKEQSLRKRLKEVLVSMELPDGKGKA